MYALPQFTFGGAWYTALYLSNPTNAPVHVTVDFHANDGSPLVVPLAGIGAFSSQAIDLNPHSTVVLEALNGNGNQVEGWAEVGLPTGATGYAVFRQVVPGRADQEAVVPLTREDSQTADLTYDNTAFITAVAFVNPTPNPVTVTITTFDAAGAQNGTTQTLLGPRSKLSAVLQSLPGLANIANVRGRAIFSVQSGAVSLLGLRFGGSAFTSIAVAHRPVVAEARTITYSLPQFIFGGVWDTTLYFSNTSSGPLSVQTSFISDSGSALSSPLTGIGSVTSQTVNLAAGATATLEVLHNGPSGQGWVEATLPPGVTGYAVFRQVIPGRENQEAVVPLTSESNQAADLVYDDTAFDTSVAFLNPSDQQATVTITIFDANGSQIGAAQVVLAPRTKIATRLRDLPGLSAMLGHRGSALFSVPNGDVSVLGLRFGGEAFTSIPVLHR
jgi:predicted secreted protein